MSIQTLKEVIKLAPEVVGHIKQAKVEREFPTDCRDSVLASALEIEYLTKVAHEYVAEGHRFRVAKAVDLYDLEADVARFSQSMTKSASAKPEANIRNEVREAELIFEGNIGGFTDLEKKASQAEDLYDNYADYITSDAVKVYAGAGRLIKSAAIRALKSRHAATGEAEFEKIAHVLEATDFDKLDADDNRVIAKAIIGLEKSANIYGRGFDFYREAFMTKEASVSSLEVTVAGSKIPVESILKVGMDKIANYLGSDVAGEMGSDPEQIKAVVEALPLDSQQLLKRIVAA